MNLEEKFPCKMCDKSFLTRSALGGHMSKSHPGTSVAYNHKKAVREKRKLERELHATAMAEYRRQYAEAGTVNRNRVKKIKRVLKN